MTGGRGRFRSHLAQDEHNGPPRGRRCRSGRGGGRHGEHHGGRRGVDDDAPAGRARWATRSTLAAASPPMSGSPALITSTSWPVARRSPPSVTGTATPLVPAGSAPRASAADVGGGDDLPHGEASRRRSATAAGRRVPRSGRAATGSSVRRTSCGPSVAPLATAGWSATSTVWRSPHASSGPLERALLALHRQPDEQCTEADGEPADPWSPGRLEADPGGELGGAPRQRELDSWKCSSHRARLRRLGCRGGSGARRARARSGAFGRAAPGQLELDEVALVDDGVVDGGRRARRARVTGRRGRRRRARRSTVTNRSTPTSWNRWWRSSTSSSPCGCRSCRSRCP